MPNATVTISDCRAGVAPLTWGQASILRILDMLRERARTTNVGGSANLPAGTGVPEALDWIRRLIERHEAMRTRIVSRDGTRAQVLDGSGALTVPIIDIDSRDDADPAGVVAELSTAEFQLAQEWPIRFAVLARGAEAATIAFAASHVMSDMWGILALQETIGRIGADPDPGVQPSDQAAFETSERGRSLDARSALYWRSQLTAMPQTLFPGPAHEPHEGARFWLAGFESPLISAALPNLAQRYGGSTSSVLHAAFAAVLATSAGADSCPLGIVAANRARPGTKDALNPYSQLIPITLPVAGQSWATMTRHAADAAILASRRGAYEPGTRDRIVREVEEERGVHLDLSMWFNDTRAVKRAAANRFDPGDPGTPGPVRWMDSTNRSDSSVYIWVFGSAEQPVMSIAVDTTKLTLGQAERLLGDVEQSLVAAAGVRDAGHVPSSVHWRPQGGRFERVDGSWVNPGDVEALLHRAGKWSDVRVGVEDGRLLAYLVPSGDAPSLTELHQACLRELPGLPSAMAPQEYLICADAPAAGGTPDPRRTVVHSGTGRSPAEDG